MKLDISMITKQISTIQRVEYLSFQVKDIAQR